MAHIKDQSEADDLVLESPREVSGAGGLVTENGTGGFDSLFDEAFVVQWVKINSKLLHEDKIV